MGQHLMSRSPELIAKYGKSPLIVPFVLREKIDCHILPNADLDHYLSRQNVTENFKARMFKPSVDLQTLKHRYDSWKQLRKVKAEFQAQKGQDLVSLY